ncbi:hypothetical protein [Marinobacter sp.]|uniref:hypothetical protein n=1 Tax=Marinobacter sp. TaxID=50741 RepID=UPI002617BCFB|nr:hypothetical protein [Marinobacter sp.]
MHHYHQISSPQTEDFGRVVRAANWLIKACPNVCPVTGKDISDVYTLANSDTLTPVKLDRFVGNAGGYCKGVQTVSFISKDAWFVLGDATPDWTLRQFSQMARSCDSSGAPSDLLVCSTLILANFLCPGVWAVDSDASHPMWPHALRLAQRCADDLFFGLEVELPFVRGIEAGDLRASLPDHLDFRR